ncbi:hypothetical protein BRM02_00620, partial [Xanthomonas oryzae pv. oryzae]
VPLACSSPVRASRLSKGSYTVQFTDSLQQGRRSLTIGLSASDSWEFYRWPTPRTPTSSASPWPR